MRAISLLTILVLSVCTSVAHAHAITLEVKVVSVKETGGEYLLELAQQNHERLPKQIFVHLQFNPKKAAFGASSSRDDFEGALAVLKLAAGLDEPLLVGLMSSMGFNPIRRRPGHYRSEMIQKVSWFQKPDVVCFFHSHHYAEAPK